MNKTQKELTQTEVKQRVVCETPTQTVNLDPNKIRSDFPMLSKVMDGKPLIYLDNAATTQKPWSVIHRMEEFECHEYATVRRGAYRIGANATEMYEGVRKKIAQFLGVEDHREIIFTSGTTYGINLVAHSFGKAFVQEGDEILISHMEHHANILPWQVLCEERGAKLKVIPVDDQGDLILEEFERLLTPRCKMLALTFVSNALGTVNPVSEMIQKAHEVGAKVLLDGAQSTPHTPVNLRELDVDFYVFSGHKIYGPSGVGVLYGKYDLLNNMPPFLVGGEMIRRVTLEKTTFIGPPARFEPGTPPISQVMGLESALDYLSRLGLEQIQNYELELLDYATQKLSQIDGLRIIGTAKEKASILSFVLGDVHAHDVVSFVDEEGISLRGGHHCAQPIMEHFNIPASARASFSFYNTKEEIDILSDTLKETLKVLG